MQGRIQREMSGRRVKISRGQIQSQGGTEQSQEIDGQDQDQGDKVIDLFQGTIKPG